MNILNLIFCIPEHQETLNIKLQSIRDVMTSSAQPNQHGSCTRWKIELKVWLKWTHYLVVCDHYFCVFAMYPFFRYFLNGPIIVLHTQSYPQPTKIWTQLQQHCWSRRCAQGTNYEDNKKNYIFYMWIGVSGVCKCLFADVILPSKLDLTWQWCCIIMNINFGVQKIKADGYVMQKFLDDANYSKERKFWISSNEKDELPKEVVP